METKPQLMLYLEFITWTTVTIGSLYFFADVK